MSPAASSELYAKKKNLEHLQPPEKETELWEIVQVIHKVLYTDHA